LQYQLHLLSETLCQVEWHLACWFIPYCGLFFLPGVKLS
jgi:hypothetical protein